MKKLLFLAIFSFTFFYYGQAAVIDGVETPVENTCELTASTYLSIEFEAEESLDGLGLISAQQLVFTDASGNSHTINVSVDTSISSGATLNASVMTSSNLTGLTAQEGQQLEMIDMVGGLTVTVDFIIIDQVIH